MFLSKKQFYFQDFKVNEYGISPLKFVDLNLYNAFQSSQSADTVKLALDDMLRFKLENYLMQIFDFSENIDTQIMESTILPRIDNGTAHDRTNTLIMILISEHSFKEANKEIKIALQKISLNLGRTISCYLFLVNSSKTFLELDNKRLVFAPFDDIVNSKIDPITLIVENIQRQKLSWQPFPAKDLWNKPTTLTDLLLFPFIIPLWYLFNFCKTTIIPKHVGSIIYNKKFPDYPFEIVHKDNNYFYLCSANNSYNPNDDYGYSGYIIGKIPVKNNNFTSLNWIEF